ncbi:MAG: Gfo/Idh/MocA family oxidoreductase [Thermoflexales bacterium]|nr:Gfo/Idh/MocA family oxidoreductase [Thermoflexales bacterium]
MTLKWGLLGTARINHALIPPLRASTRNELAAVASRGQERAEAYAREWGIPRAFGSYESLLADPAIDVVYIPLPNSLHAEWTIKAVQAGKHVLCEKPLALSPEQVDAISAAAAQAGRVVAEAFMYRHHPQTLQVKALLDSGAIGALRLVRASFSFNLTNSNDVRLEPDMGGGCLWDVGCYPVSFARYLAGAEPVEVFGWQITGPSGIDELFAGQLRFAGSPAWYAQFDCSFRVPLRTQLEIVGSEGVIGLPAPFTPGTAGTRLASGSGLWGVVAALPQPIKSFLRKLLARMPGAVQSALQNSQEEFFLLRDSQSRAIKLPRQDLYAGEVEDMADAILLSQAPRVSLTDSRGNVATLGALLRSAREGQPVPLI